MYEAIRKKLWTYILENRPDILSELRDQQQEGLYLDELMWETKSSIKQLLSQGLNRNKILWICLSKLIDKISRRQILIVRIDSVNDEYDKLRTGSCLTAPMIDLMLLGDHHISKGGRELVHLMKDMSAESLAAHLRTVAALN